MHLFSFYFSFTNIGCELFTWLRYVNHIYGAEDEREFDYVEGSKKGPSHWGEIREEWAHCKNGSMQSPIDLSSWRVKLMPKLGELKRSYKPFNATLKNRGHDIAVSNQKLLPFCS